MPHSYASSLARLKRRGPTIGAIATENSANAAAKANSPMIGTYGDSDTAAVSFRITRWGLHTLFRATPAFTSGAVALVLHASNPFPQRPAYAAGASRVMAFITRSVASPPRGSVKLAN